MDVVVEKFEMHDNLLRDLITKQAGSLDKAALEGIMNLVEAGATRGNVILTNTKLVIEDDGKGFESEQEIRDAFKTFGKSDERAMEHKRWARFQMGRGQLFAFGKTTYRTRTFEMVTDINNKGLSYEFRKDLVDQPGCVVTVELYEPIDAYQIASIVRDVKRNITYVPLSITMNGDLVTTDVSTIKWTFEDDDAYVKVNESARSLKIYNLGVFVQEKYMSGVGGVLVSKRQLEVNFARNQVIDSCPIYKRLKTQFRTKTKAALIDRKSYGAEDAGNVLDGFESHEYSPDLVFWKPLFQTTEQKKISFGKLFDVQMYSIDDRGSVKAAQAMRTNSVIVLDRDHFETVLGSSDRARFERLMEFAKHGHGGFVANAPSYIPPDELYVDVVDERSIFSDKEISKDEALALKILNDTFDTSFMRFADGSIEHRTIVLGKTDNSEISWTDGNAYIAINRSHFAKRIRSTGGWAALLVEIAHSYAHDSQVRDHNEQFMSRFHDCVDIFVSKTGDIVKQYVRKSLASGAMTPRFLVDEDRSSSTLEANDTTDDTSSNDEQPGLGFQ